MVSRVPTYSFKKAKIPQAMVIPVLLLAALFVVGLTGAPWKTLSFGGLIYIISIPVSMRSYARLKAEAERMHVERDGGEEGPEADTGPREPPRLRPVD